jgi:hypothetical protein
MWYVRGGNAPSTRSSRQASLQQRRVGSVGDKSAACASAGYIGGPPRLHQACSAALAVQRHQCSARARSSMRRVSSSAVTPPPTAAATRAASCAPHDIRPRLSNRASSVALVGLSFFLSKGLADPRPRAASGSPKRMQTPRRSAAADACLAVYTALTDDPPASAPALRHPPPLSGLGAPNTKAHAR